MSLLKKGNILLRIRLESKLSSFHVQYIEVLAETIENYAVMFFIKTQKLSILKYFVITFLYLMIVLLITVLNILPACRLNAIGMLFTGCGSSDISMLKRN